MVGIFFGGDGIVFEDGSGPDGIVFHAVGFLLECEVVVRRGIFGFTLDGTFAASFLAVLKPFVVVVYHRLHESEHSFCDRLQIVGQHSVQTILHDGSIDFQLDVFGQSLNGRVEAAVEQY